MRRVFTAAPRIACTDKAASLLSLPVFDIEPVTEWMEQERQRKAHEADRLQQEQREIARLERERQNVQHQQVTGRNASQEMRNKRRLNSTELNKFKVIRPTAATIPPPPGSSSGMLGIASAAGGVSSAHSDSSSITRMPPTASGDGR